MTRMTTTRLATGLAALVMTTGILATPAAAGGSISLSVAPTNPDQARAMRAGLMVYSLVQRAEGGASINQMGHGNSAGIGQNGHGNHGIVHQEGNGHDGTLQQNGNNNAYGLFQFGENTDGHVVQNGNGQTGATVQFGW